VIAALSEVQPDKLRRVETWLWCEDGTAPRFAVLIDFVPVATGPASSGYAVGDRLEAELVFYPSAVPLRAQIVSVKQGAQASSDDLQLPSAGLTSAMAEYERALGTLPWLGTLPLAFKQANIRAAGESLFLCDTEGSLALPLHSAQAGLALPLASVGKLDGMALWNGYHLTLCWAQTELGRWVNA